MEVRPYEPLTGVIGINDLDTYDVVLPPGTKTLILNPSPLRLYAIVFLPSATVSISPFSDSSTYSLNPTAGATDPSVLISHVVYPGLVQREWFALSPGGCIVRVIDVKARG